MNGREEREHLKAKLDEELTMLHFAGQSRVTERSHPHGLLRRIHAFWNKELEIPVVPVATIIAVLAGTLLIGRIRGTSDTDQAATPVNRVLVNEGDNYYWQDDYERAVASIEIEDPH